MTDFLQPAAEWELQSMLAQVVKAEACVEVVGLGALREFGRPATADAVITTKSIRGITLYEPTELVMSARAGTPLVDIERELAGNGQMLAFEPMDLGPAVGTGMGGMTIGGVFAINCSGPRRVAQGGARDHLLGMRAVNGRAEVFKSGGRVMKNVTGVDLSRALTGSFGTLAVVSEVTFKVMPRPEAETTLVFSELSDEHAIEALTAAMGTPYEVSAAAHVDAEAAQNIRLTQLRELNSALTLVRIENFADVVLSREQKLRAALKVFGAPVTVSNQASQSLWAEFTSLSMLPPDPETVLWRISTRPTKGPEIVAAVRKVMDARAVYDWSGGMIWLEVPVAADAGASDIRRAVAIRGGHATLVRAPAEIRSVVEVFEPMKPEVEKLARGIKEAFDPRSILNRGRMYRDI